MWDLTSLPSNRKLTKQIIENAGAPSAAYLCLLQGLNFLKIISAKQYSIETKNSKVSNVNEDL